MFKSILYIFFLVFGFGYKLYENILWMLFNLLCIIICLLLKCVCLKGGVIYIIVFGLKILIFLNLFFGINF